YKALGFTGLNAFTSNERTVFVCSMPKNRLAAWARLESDRFAHPVFRLFQSELEAVFEEKNRAMDNPGTVIWEALQKGLFGTNPYATPVLGWVDQIKNPSLTKMYRFYETYYVPNNRAIVLAGDFDPAQAMSVIEKSFGAWKPRRLPSAPFPSVLPLQGAKRITVNYEAEEEGMVAWPTVENGSPDQDALTVMDMVVSNGQSGLIDLRLNQAQKVKNAYSSPEFLNHAGYWYIDFQPKEGQTLEQAEALAMGMVDDLKKGDFSEDDLKAIVLNFEIAEKYKLESNDDRVQEMADSFADRESWAHRAERLERLRKVTKADVIRVANKYLGDDRVVVYRRKGKPDIPHIDKPGFTKVAIQPGRESEFIKSLLVMPVRPIRPRWVAKGRDYQEREMPFGKLIAVKNPMNDLFSLSYRVDRGTRQDRELAAAMALWDKAGAGDLDADAFKKKLYGLGVTMSAWAGERSSGWTFSGPDASLEPALALLRERFRRPNVAPGTLEKMVQIWVGQHKDNKVDPEAVRGALADWAERGKDSPVLNELNDGELKGLKEADLEARLTSFLGWRGRASYVGPRAAGAVADLLTEKGASYEAPPPLLAVTLVRPLGPRVVFVDRDMVQSKVGLFSSDGPVDPKRILDYTFFSNYMGGGMSSVIFQEVREARSLAYSAWGGYEWGTRPGDDDRLQGVLGCQADKTQEAVGLMLKLLRDPPFTPDRFAETKKSVLQRYRTDPLTFRDVPGAVLGWEDLGYRSDPRPARFQAAQGYTLAKLKAFAARMKDKVMTVYILGNKKRVDLSALSKFGAVEETKVDDLFPY
ncbi:MAG: insulinase family protein, partial [Elusimicrobia bacterium]|nr:insulinase family protein [Elusimicrobiota bacterium]